jgi:predicted esterase
MQHAAKKVVFETVDPEKIDALNEKAVDFLQADFDGILMQANRFVGQREYLKAAQYYLALLKFNLNDSTTIYNLACCYGRLGKADLAVKSLVMAVRAGFRDFKLLENDKDFAPIRHTPEFRALLSRIPLWQDPAIEVIFVKTGKLLELQVKLPHKFDSTQRYPLLLGLHGNGGSPDHMMETMNKALKKEPVILAAPHGAYPNFSQLRGRHFSWEIQTRNRELWKIADPLAVENLNEVILEIKKKYLVGEVYILGFSQGAAYAFLSGFAYSEMVAGIIAIGGLFPETDTEFSLLKEKDIENGKKFRVFIAQGNNDRLIPKGLAAQTAARLKNYGYEVECQEYEGGHEISPQLIKKIYAWMMKE